MIIKTPKSVARHKRHFRLRNKVTGTALRPRLAVFRSNKHIYAQLIDDVAGNTLVSAGSTEKDIASKIESGSNCDAAKIVGEAIARKAVEKGFKEVVFDRGGYIYHGRVQALADSAREAGLQF